MPKKRRQYNKEYKPGPFEKILRLPPGDRPEIAAMLTPTLDRLLDLQRDLATTAKDFQRVVAIMKKGKLSPRLQRNLAAIAERLSPELYQRLWWNIVGQVLPKSWAKPRRESLRKRIIQWYVDNGQTIEQACDSTAAALKDTPAAVGADRLLQIHYRRRRPRL
jgi:hypothetical protein